MRVPKSETIEYFLYEHGGESAQEVHMSLLHATLHELTHWAISEKANDELGSNHSAKWAVEIEKVIRHVNGTCLLDKQVGKIEVTFEEPDD